jgi:hypothetical protein
MPLLKKRIDKSHNKLHRCKAKCLALWGNAILKRIRPYPTIPDLEYDNGVLLSIDSHCLVQKMLRGLATYMVLTLAKMRW